MWNLVVGKSSSFFKMKAAGCILLCISILMVLGMTHFYFSDPEPNHLCYLLCCGDGSGLINFLSSFIVGCNTLENKNHLNSLCLFCLNFFNKGTNSEMLHVALEWRASIYDISILLMTEGLRPDFSVKFSWEHTRKQTHAYTPTHFIV